MNIQTIEVFKGLDPDVIDEIVGISDRKETLSNEILFNQGDRAENLYILEEGALLVRVAGSSTPTYMARTPGELFGWSSLVGRAEYSASVECSEPSRLAVINKDEIQRILGKYPADASLFFRRLAGVLGDRLIKCYEMINNSQSGYE